MIQLKSRWADEVNVSNVHQEYPRPNLVRDSYFNLNGEWEYCINQDSKMAEFNETILVPFSPETLLSGVQKIVIPKDFLHYRKSFILPEGFCKDRVILHFGAVDQECVVYMNGTKIGTHKGGYLAFSFDVTKYLKEGNNILTLCVRDMTEEKPHARGKQKLVKKGKYGSLFYTPQSGIWKTVWMESVAADYVEKVKITPMYDEEAIEINVFAKGSENKALVKVLDGATVGRNANRIGKASFVYKGNFYQLDKNDGNNNLHSGFDFWSFRIWKVKETTENSITFAIHSEDGDQGYPGTVDAEVTYTLTDENSIVIDYYAKADADY